MVIPRPIQIALLTVTLTIPTTKAVWGQEPSMRKLDKHLQRAVKQGCPDGRQEVIIRGSAGFRKDLRTSLSRHGNKVTAEFSSIDAVAAEVDCRDLAAVSKLPGAVSISTNAQMEAHAGPNKDYKAIGLKGPAKGDKGDKGGKPGKHDPPTQGEAAGKLQAPMFHSTLASATWRAASYLSSPTSTSIDSSLNHTLHSLIGAGFTGHAGGVGIAVIDSGITAGPEFEDRITAFYDFTQGDIRATAPVDEFGHGTHVAGLIAGRNVGLAPGARLVGLKVLDTNGKGTTSNTLHAIEFAIANKAQLNIHILNLSLGHPIYESAATDPLVQAVERAVREGFIVVVSAGNFGINKKTGLPGYAGIASPGNSPSAITAGATRMFDTVSRVDDRVTPYSSRGPSWYDGFAKPDVVAPGDNILSVAAAGSKLRHMQELRGNTGEYMRLSGTSMAAGVTSGMVALVLEMNPGLTPNALKAVVQYTAIPVLTDEGPAADGLTQGAGQINGGGAIALARSINTDAPVGKRWLTTWWLPPTTFIGDRFYPWFQAVLWGNRAVSGETLMTEQRPAWASSIVWGEGLGIEDDNIVWGNRFDDDDNIVWGNLFDDGDNIVWGNNIVWNNTDDNIVWGNRLADDDNIVWGNNIVWGRGALGILDDDNIVWGNLIDDDNIVWGNLEDDNIVWGNLLDDDNIVWGNSLLSGSSGKGGKR
jgi:serine protease AprX